MMGAALSLSPLSRGAGSVDGAARSAGGAWNAGGSMVDGEPMPAVDRDRGGEGAAATGAVSVFDGGMMSGAGSEEGVLGTRVIACGDHTIPR